MKKTTGLRVKSNVKAAGICYFCGSNHNRTLMVSNKRTATLPAKRGIKETTGLRVKSNVKAAGICYFCGGNHSRNLTVSNKKTATPRAKRGIKAGGS